jgi:hypothetical protein
MSYAVGSTVGKYYRNLYSGETSSLQPPANPAMEINPTGISLTFMF